MSLSIFFFKLIKNALKYIFLVIVICKNLIHIQSKKKTKSYFFILILF